MESDSNNKPTYEYVIIPLEPYKYSYFVYKDATCIKRREILGNTDEIQSDAWRKTY